MLGPLLVASPANRINNNDIETGKNMKKKPAKIIIFKKYSIPYGIRDEAFRESKTSFSRFVAIAASSDFLCKT